MAPSALVLIADGTEEMEFTITYDTLVRAGVSTRSALVLSKDQEKPTSGLYPAKGSRGIGILADVLFENPQTSFGPDKYDLLVVPGGAKGAETISGSSEVQDLIKQFVKAEKYVGLICAGSLAALSSKLQKQPITSHPSVKNQLENDFEYSEDPVVVSSTLVTSRGPGTAFPFALTLVELLLGAEKRKEVREPMIFPSGTPF